METPTKKEPAPGRLNLALALFATSLAPDYSPDPVRYMFFIAPRVGTLMVRKK